MMEVPKEANRPISQENLTQGPKMKMNAILEKLKTALKNLKIRDLLTDPKKRLLVIAGICLALIVALLVIGILFKSINSPRQEAKPSASPTSTKAPATEELSVEQRLRNLRDEITISGFEEKSLVIPEIDFKIEFKLE